MEPATEPRKPAFPCDACRRRKVRCNYAKPCDRCQSYNLVCTFDTVRRKRGPKRGRGAVVDQLRAESSRSVSTTSDSASSPSGGTTPDSPSLGQWRNGDGLHHSNHDALSSTAPAPPRSGPYAERVIYDQACTNNDFLTFDEFAHSVLDPSQQGLPPARRSHVDTSSSPESRPNLTTSNDNLKAKTDMPFSLQSYLFAVDSITERGIDLFFSHMYPIYPLLDENQIRSRLLAPSEMGPATSCLLFSMCAMTLVQVESWPDLSTDQRALHARRYIHQCQEIRMQLNFIEDATFEDMLCSLFIGMTWFELKCRRTSWFYVREAITLAQAIGLHTASRDKSLGDLERLRSQRAYALLFITERGAAILDNFPVTILSPPSLPIDSIPGEDPAVSLGLGSLHHLFSLLDFNFVHIWNDLEPQSSADRGYWQIARLQEHLRQKLQIQGLSDIQRADLSITQQWLRLVFWQAALRLGLISSSAADSAFTYHYPIEIATSLSEIVKGLPPAAIQVHGLGIFEKQFEIAYSLLDALTLSGSASQPADHHETLRYLLLSLSASPNSRQIYVRTLEKKMDGGAGPEASVGEQQKYRHLAGVELLRDDGSVRGPSRRASLV